MLRPKLGLFERRLETYRRVPPVEDSVGVDSKEWFFKLILQVKEVFLEILVPLTVVISNDLFVYFSRYSRSSKFLFNEHAFIWKKDRDFFYQVILVLVFIKIKISRIYNIFWINILVRRSVVKLIKQKSKIERRC